MDRQTLNQLDRIEDKLDNVLIVYYEQDKNGYLVRKGEDKKEDNKSYAAE